MGLIWKVEWVSIKGINLLIFLKHSPFIVNAWVREKSEQSDLLVVSVSVKSYMLLSMENQMMTSGTDGYYEHAEKYIKLARKFIQAFP